MHRDSTLRYPSSTDSSLSSTSVRPESVVGGPYEILGGVPGRGPRGYLDPRVFNPGPPQNFNHKGLFCVLTSHTVPARPTLSSLPLQSQPCSGAGGSGPP